MIRILLELSPAARLASFNFCNSPSYSCRFESASCFKILYSMAFSSSLLASASAHPERSVAFAHAVPP